MAAGVDTLHDEVDEASAGAVRVAAAGIDTLPTVPSETFLLETAKGRVGTKSAASARRVAAAATQGACDAAA